MTKITRSAINWTFLILLVAPILSPSLTAFAATISPVTGSSAGAGPNTTVFFPSVAGPLNGTQVATVSGTDNIGGAFVEQEMFAFDQVDGPTGSCTVNGVAGQQFPLIEAAAVRTYASGGELYLLAFGSANGSECPQVVTCGTVPVRFTYSLNYSAVGGTATFNQASGTLSQSTTGAALAVSGGCVNDQYTGGAFLSFSETITGGSITP
jgi:hypothetical protein